MLDQLMDGCCCAIVLAEAAPEEVAGVFGTGEQVEPGSSTDGRDLVVTRVAASAWSMVLFSYREEMEHVEGDTDSDPLIRQARSIVAGEVPKAAIGFTSSVTTAAKISGALGIRSIGIWGSDQGEGIGGAAVFAGGQLDECLSAAGVAELEKIKKIRAMEEYDQEVDDLLEEIEETCEGYFWRRKAGETSRLEGRVEEAFDEYLNILGLDADDCLDYYDSLISCEASDESTTFVVDRVGPALR